MSARVLSLFSGGGGLDLGLETAGAQVAAMCEIDPHAASVLRHHWPDTPVHDDVTTLNPEDFRGRIDLVAGGSPCQDLSVAGRRGGLDGARSGLFWHQCRIADSVHAKWVLWENVAGALSSNDGADFAAVLWGLTGALPDVPDGGWRTAGVVVGPKRTAVGPDGESRQPGQLSSLTRTATGSAETVSYRRSPHGSGGGSLMRQRDRRVPVWRQRLDVVPDLRPRRRRRALHGGPAMSCRCPIQPDYCVDEPVTEIDCWECPTCRISMTAVDLGIVLRHKDRLIERLHATRSTLMAERDSALDQRNEARFLAENLRDGLLTTPRYRSGAGAEPVMDLPWEVVEAL